MHDRDAYFYAQVAEKVCVCVCQMRTRACDGWKTVCAAASLLRAGLPWAVSDLIALWEGYLLLQWRGATQVVWVCFSRVIGGKK